MAAKKATTGKVTATAGAAKRDATVFLQRDHTELHRLLRQYARLVKSNADVDERIDLARNICSLVMVHAQIEEVFFYPAAREAGVDDRLMDEADVEHELAKYLAVRLEEMGPEDEPFDAYVKVLGEYVDHHVQEEEGKMFPKCRKSGMDLAALAIQLAERKADLMAPDI